eukprot:TRINITY_DN22786_c0_g2_i4.p1 TRINITY_DN22786_c0_g2~~TRINITY_DN22786_c0_g2_i4.p1  ORF type:complete len:226 (+),score=37.39 TRINITY_DN22786_c0_g2_i4:150-827(+)
MATALGHHQQVQYIVIETCRCGHCTSSHVDGDEITAWRQAVSARSDKTTTQAHPDGNSFADRKRARCPEIPALPSSSGLKASGFHDALEHHEPSEVLTETKAIRRMFGNVCKLLRSQLGKLPDEKASGDDDTVPIEEVIDNTEAQHIKPPTDPEVKSLTNHEKKETTDTGQTAEVSTFAAVALSKGVALFRYLPQDYVKNGKWDVGLGAFIQNLDRLAATATSRT